MSKTDIQNSTPDSWDQNEEQGAGDKDISQQLSEIKLNADAPSFVPGQNVFAASFVPSFVSSSNTANKVNEQQTTDNKPTEKTEEDIPPDDWAENGGEEGGGSSEEQVDSEGSEPQIVQVKPKAKKIVDVEPPKEKKEHINVVFIGHVDAGKSTIGGQLMYLTGMVEKRTLEKYEREAKEKNRESWYLSWALDTNQEERDKGKTVEVGRAFFETENRHFTILDAPGHRSFVPNMIGGASQADLAVLVISARKGEFETGYERGGQTREHAMLAKTAGIKALVVLVNKMDDPTVQWAESRYNDIKDKLTPYLRKCGFNPKTDVYYIPCSGLTGANLKELRTDVCPWFSGKPLIKYLNELPNMSREANGPVRVPIVDRYKDMGVIALGKVESGQLSKGQLLVMMPNKQTVEIMQLWSDDVDTDIANPGENVKVKLKNVEEEDVSPGFVLCSADGLCHTGKVFDAQIVILEHKSIICAGYSAVLHIHTCAEEVTIKLLICTVDKKTGEKSKTRPRFVKQDQIAIARLEVSGGIICLEPFKQFPQMGRFTLRDEGKTIAIGKVLKIVE